MSVRRTITWIAVLAVLLAGTGVAGLLHEATHARDARAATSMDCSGCPIDSSDSAPADDHDGDDDCPTCDFLKTLTAATPTPASVATVEPEGVWLASVAQTLVTRDVRSGHARAPPITIV